MGIGGVLLLGLLSMVFWTDFFSLVGGGGAGAPATSEAPIQDPAEEEEVLFMSKILDDAQANWTAEFARSNLQYRDAELALFRDSVQSGCGYAQSAMGPFYCPADQRVYIDLGFFEELQRRFGAPGDFAQAYVLAHEIGHHVQNQLGVSNQVRQAQSQARSQAEANELSVLLELQADCFAGVWAHTTQEGRQEAGGPVLEAGDLEEGLAAAAAVGDDRIQSRSTGGVNPETWTHGSSEQRARWFRVGFETGDADRCDTFAASSR
jgi:predicted metalloprotease